MTFFSCRACAAKDAEIARLSARTERYEQEILSLIRQRAGFGTQEPVSQPLAPVPPRLDPTVEVFLDAKFVYATPLWRQQHREAEKLLADGVDAERVMEVLARGQQIEV